MSDVSGLFFSVFHLGNPGPELNGSLGVGGSLPVSKLVCHTAKQKLFSHTSGKIQVHFFAQLQTVEKGYHVLVEKRKPSKAISLLQKVRSGIFSKAILSLPSCDSVI